MDCREGDGVIVEENRDLPPFHAIDAGSIIEVVIRQADTCTVHAVAERNLQGMILTENRNGILHLGMSGCVRTNQPLRVYVSAPTIRGLSLHGVGNIHVSGTLDQDTIGIAVSGGGTVSGNLHAYRVLVNIQGPGSIRLSGTTREAKVLISGSGNVDSPKWHVERLFAVLTGRGNCDVSVTDMLEGSISGSGNIWFSGSPAVVHVLSTGSGRAKRVDR
ncbi:MAG: head GIN domain-containing protein [Bacteroidota bacterium]|nr:head GIN domain-containing protein [Bacteroidota bacterium]